MITTIERKYRPLFKNYEELKHINPNPKSTGFETCIWEIYLCYNGFYENYTSNKP